MWREDMARTGEAGGFQVTEEALNCPLGTRKGEVHVWKSIAKRPERLKGRAVRT